MTLRLLPLLLLCTLPVTAQAQGYSYATNHGTLTIIGYTCPDGAAIIPATFHGLPVTSIEAYAFHGCDSLTSVTIPNSVTSIGRGAFAACGRLTAITVDALNPAYSSLDGVLFNKSQLTLIQCPGGKAGSYLIPDRVTNIGDDAFDSCTGLTAVTIPEGVISIEDGAFDSCASLTSVTIPNSVIYIGGYYAFSFCTRLTAITVGAFNSVYSSVDGVLFNKSQTELIQYPGGKAGSFTIPDSVTSIRHDSFSSCRGLTSVTIPGAVTSIEDNAFADCDSLTAITVNALNPVYSSVDGVLLNKGQTTLLRCPGGKTGSYTVPNSVTGIVFPAFAHCTGITSVTIPKSVTSIENAVFAGCHSLTAITVDALNSVYSSVDGVLLNKGQTTLFQCPEGRAGSYTIPNSVTSIVFPAFLDCRNLTSITIPNSVTSIGPFAFASCAGLTSMTIPSSVSHIGDGAFDDCSSLSVVYFQGNAPSVGEGVFDEPNEAIAVYYLPGATGWGKTFGGRPTVLWKSQGPPHPEVHDLAVTKITVPRVVNLTTAKPAPIKRIAVTIQNRGSHSETINTLEQFTNLVSLAVESLDRNSCGDIPAFVSGPPQKKLPFTLRSKQKLTVFFNVTFDCAADSAKGTGHEDFRYLATVHHEAIDGIADGHPECDTCPRPPLPGGVDPNPNGKLKDNGCGAPRGDGTFGADVLTDVVRKE